MDLTNEDVADVLALLDSLPYDELDLQTARFRLVLRRTPDGWTQAVQTRSAPNMLDAAAAGVTGGASEAAAEPPAAASDPPGASEAAPMEHRCRYSDTDVPSVSLGEGADLADREADGASGESGELDEGLRERLGGGPGLVAVRAPLPGTFYRAPRPGAAPFVEVGSRVDPDTVVGIMETMKLMNSVTAGVAGAVAEICLANAEFAAHGATLLRIRAD
jgi:acetyl-CoA carboxylase biotin carboxyl carrier protein